MNNTETYLFNLALMILKSWHIWKDKKHHPNIEAVENSKEDWNYFVTNFPKDRIGTVKWLVDSCHPITGSTPSSELTNLSLYVSKQQRGLESAALADAISSLNWELITQEIHGEFAKLK